MRVKDDRTREFETNITMCISYFMMQNPVPAPIEIIKCLPIFTIILDDPKSTDSLSYMLSSIREIFKIKDLVLEQHLTDASILLRMQVLYLMSDLSDIRRLKLILDALAIVLSILQKRKKKVDTSLFQKICEKMVYDFLSDAAFERCSVLTILRTVIELESETCLRIVEGKPGFFEGLGRTIKSGFGVCKTEAVHLVSLLFYRSKEAIKLASLVVHEKQTLLEYITRGITEIDYNAALKFLKAYVFLISEHKEEKSQIFLIKILEKVLKDRNGAYETELKQMMDIDEDFRKAGNVILNLVHKNKYPSSHKTTCQGKNGFQQLDSKIYVPKLKTLKEKISRSMQSSFAHKDSTINQGKILFKVPKGNNYTLSSQNIEDFGELSEIDSKAKHLKEV